MCLTTRSATIMQALLSLSLALSDELDLQSLPDALLSKIMACMTTTEGRGLLLCCRRLTERPGTAERVSQTAEGGAHIMSIFWSSGFATTLVFAIWAQHPPSRGRLQGSW